MAQVSYPAVFMRGGTSKGLFFRAEDLPADRTARDRFFLGALGSPDPHGRQLDGMGGGVSSLSKAMVVWRSAREGVDVDYDFAQVSVDRALVDYGSNCGNLSSAVGIFAVEAGLVRLPDGEARVRMFNVNTRKRVDCVFGVAGGHARVSGEAEIAGVPGRARRSASISSSRAVRRPGGCCRQARRWTSCACRTAPRWRPRSSTPRTCASSCGRLIWA